MIDKAITEISESTLFLTNQSITVHKIASLSLIAYSNLRSHNIQLSNIFSYCMYRAGGAPCNVRKAHVGLRSTTAKMYATSKAQQDQRWFNITC
jgi:hypothetical protein